MPGAVDPGAPSALLHRLFADYYAPAIIFLDFLNHETHTVQYTQSY